jgi:hypothetical protein
MELSAKPERLCEELSPELGGLEVERVSAHMRRAWILRSFKWKVKDGRLPETVAVGH